MTVYHREAQNAEEIAKHLRARGRTIITAPARSGKTTELLRYAEERYPNGRFAVVVARGEERDRIIKMHWQVANGISFVDVVAKRLLGEELEGEGVNEPTVLFPPHIYFENQFQPIFVDDFNLLPSAAQRAILKRHLFIAAVQGEDNAEEEG